MRLAREVPKLDDQRRNAVADLSLREAAKAIASSPMAEKRVDPAEVVEAEVESDAAEDQHADTGPSDGDHVLAAILGIAKLKISGTAAAKGYEWSDAELAKAKKAATWLRMFLLEFRRDRQRRQYSSGWRS